MEYIQNFHIRTVHVHVYSDQSLLITLTGIADNHDSPHRVQIDFLAPLHNQWIIIMPNEVYQ